MLKYLFASSEVSEIDREEYGEIIQHKIEYHNAVRGRMLLFLTVVLELFLIAYFDIVNIIKHGWFERNGLYYLIAHSVLCINALIGFVSATFYLKNRESKIFKHISGTTQMMIYSCVFLILVAFINGLDQAYSSSISMFIFFLLMVSFFTISKPKYFVLIGALSVAVFIITMYQFQDDSQLFRNNVVNLGLAFFTTSIISYVGYNHFYGYIYTTVKLEKTTKKLEVLSETDELTGVVNRRKLEKNLGMEISRARRLESHFSVLMIDIDKFKVINDEYGHVFGDKVLKKIAQYIKSEVRLEDTVCRFGGEEFFVILTNTNLPMACNKAEYFRNSIAEMDFEGEKVTVSIGVTEYSDLDTIENIIKRSDKFMYRAKDKGRNQVFSDFYGKC